MDGKEPVRMSLTDMRPIDGQGSFAFEISIDDVKKALYQVLLVIISAVASYAATTWMPELQASWPFIVPAVTAALQFIDKWARDTRSSLEKQRVSPQMYREALKHRV